MAELLSLVFNGRQASDGQLHFYEYGRATYGYARFISTIETFRRTGRVPQRIVGAAKVELIIKAAERGSFPIDIIAPIATVAGSELASLPLKILTEYVLHYVQRILPSDEAKILRATKLQLEIEKQRTAQSGKETKRIEAIERMVKDQNVNTRLALDMMNEMSQRDSRALNAFDNVDEVERIKSTLKLSDERQKSLEEYMPTLSKIDSDKMLKLTSKVRPQIAEMAIPLKKSANSMEFAFGDDRKVTTRLQEADVYDINGVTAHPPVKSSAVWVCL